MTEDKSHRAGYESGGTSAKKTILWGVVIIVATIASVIVLNEYFVSVGEGPGYDLALRPQSVTLFEIRSNEDEILNSYKLLDSTTGQYRIPVERAIELVAEEAIQASENR